MAAQGAPRVGFIGLGAMGGGMAGALVKEGFSVCGFDVSSCGSPRPQVTSGRLPVTSHEAKVIGHRTPAATSCSWRCSCSVTAHRAPQIFSCSFRHPFSYVPVWMTLPLL